MSRLKIWLFVAVFALGITTPLVVSVVQPDLAVSNSEKRRLAQWPTYSRSGTLTKYFEHISSYFNDHFGFRESLIRLNTLFTYWLGGSPSGNAVIGQDDWKFFKTIDPSAWSFIAPKVIEGNLQARLALFEARRAFLHKRELPYLYTVVPNKMTLYSEYLPQKYGLLDHTNTYRRYLELLDTKNNPQFFDSVQWLEQIKKQQAQRIYFKNDTHWNALGAYHETRGLFASLTKTYSLPLKLTPRSFTPGEHRNGDVAVYLGLDNVVADDEPVSPHPPCTNRSKVTKIDEDLARVDCNANNVTVLLLGDSFMAMLYPYIAENVGTLYMANEGMSMQQFAALVERVNPDIVIEQIVQRNIAKELDN